MAGWILAAIFNIFTTLVNKEHVKQRKINQRTPTLRTNYKKPTITTRLWPAARRVLGTMTLIYLRF